MSDPRPMGMRIQRPYQTEEEFIHGDGLTIGRTGMILLGAPARPPGIIIRFEKIEGDYLIGFLLLQLANATFAAGQVLCRQLLARYPTEQPLHRFFGHFFLGAMLLALPSFLLFGDLAKMPHTAVQWGVLVWMGLFATALGMFWWVKGSTQVDAGTLAIMNELHVPAGLLVNLLIWNRDANLPKLLAGGAVIMGSLWLNRLGRRMGRRLAAG